MNKVQEPTVRKTLTVATSRIPWQPLIGLVAAIVVMSIVVVSGQELKHVPPASPTFVVLHRFTGADGASPIAGLIRDAAGNLYGTTYQGGAFGHGVVFELIRCNSGYDFEMLYSFTAGADGADPVAGLVRDTAGNLYGTTVVGGTSNSGVVFKLSPTGTETVLYSFSGGADGGQPVAGLVRDAAGSLYGTTRGGGSSACSLGAGNCGVVFKVSPTRTETVLHSFTGGADGAFPQAGLIQDLGGNLYGTTALGGATSTCNPSFGCGVVFKLTLTGTETVLHSFTGADGGPYALGLIQDAAGNLYGTTNEGGSSACEGGCGAVFKLSPIGIGTVLHRFTGGADGFWPFAGLIQDTAGNLYGTTLAGGAESQRCVQPTCGVVFRLSPTGTETVLHTFTGSADGGSPQAGLIQDAAGNLYGTAAIGGATNTCNPPYGCGVVFRLTP